MLRAVLCSFVVAFSATFSLSATAAVLSPEIRDAMQDRDYPRAIQAIDQQIAQNEQDHDYLNYLKGRAYHYQGKYDEALEVFDRFDERFPDSQWSRRARFAQAAALLRLGKHQAAELVYRAEATDLLTAARKQDIADIYLEFADTYFDPDDDDQSPNYEKARKFYEKALEIIATADRRNQIRLQIGRCFQAEKNYDQAIAHYSKLLNQDSLNEVLEIDVRNRLGQSYLDQGNMVSARRAWEDLLAKSSDTDTEIIAQTSYRIALTHGVPKPDSTQAMELGISSLRKFISRFPDHKLASKAHLEIAECFLHRGRYGDATSELKIFLDNGQYAGSTEVPRARFLMGTSYQRQKQFAQAITAWRDYLTKHPAHEDWSNAQRQIVQTEFLIADQKRKDEEYSDARRLFDEFLVKYPLDRRAPLILYLQGQMNFAQEEWEQAIADWRRVISKYPQTKTSSTARLMIALTLEEKLGKLEEALEEYKKIDSGPAQGRARARTDRLTSKRLVVRTERVFRTDETPHIKLTTRNIEKVTVSSYRIDLETYFRKMHLASGVENLDIALIDPDQQFEFEVPDYAKYKRIESEVPLGADDEDGQEPGVLVVTVRGETRQATTMVPRSDLDIIAKSSRDEVFVFAENMVTGRPWPGVRLLVSNGGQVFAEVETGEDGVFQGSFEELKSSNDVRVFAVSDGHTASNIVGLNGLGVAQGLTNKGYIYSDRPAYRPGQLVNIRGIVRRVADDTYRIDAGKRFELSVLDPRNRPVWQQDVLLSQFGSFHSHFVLPKESPLGHYRILISDKGKQSYQGTFQVHQYSLEQVQLSIESERNVFYRGEQIEGTISAQYYYGAPLNDREIRYRLADGRVHTARTDKNGQVQFKLPTRDFRETQVLPLVAELPDQNVSVTRPFVLARQGYSIAVSTVRPVYLAGETFEVTLRTLDAEGKPMGRELDVSVIEQVKVTGAIGTQREVERKQAVTDDETGEAQVTLAIQAGGSYILRAEGVDRFDNSVSGEHPVSISGDDDRIRLRILADRHTYKVGDEPTIAVHWRDEPALALVTYQGARVLGYQLVQFEQGKNQVTVPMTANLAPNFELAISVMTDVRHREQNKIAFQPFHEASTPMTVKRDLRVKVTRDGEQTGSTVRPDQPIQFLVTTTDPQGNPVSAELSLAMIEQSLLSRYPSNVPRIGAFFQGGLRSVAVRTTSSIRFDYRPKTRDINERLLADASRRELEEVESERRLELAARVRAVDELATANRAEPMGDNLFDFDVDDSLTDHERSGQADFDSLIEVITETIEPESWEELGGAGTVVEFEGANLSLAVSQTQEVHEVLDQAEQNRMLQESPIAYPDARTWQSLGGMGGGAMGAMGGGAMRGGMAGRGLGRAGQVAGANQQRGFGLGESASPATGAAWGYRVIPTDQIAMFGDYLNTNGTAQLARMPSLTAVTNKGAVLHYNAAAFEGDAGAKVVQQLTREQAVLITGLPSLETGYWNPAVRTDEKGQATVEFTMPDRVTAWKLLACGISKQTLAGQSELELVSKKELFGELKLPLAFTDGDVARVVATIHNNTGEVDADDVVTGDGEKEDAAQASRSQNIKVTLKTTIGKRTTTQTQTIDRAGPGTQELAFEIQLERPGEVSIDADTDAAFELVVSSGDKQLDRLVRSVPIVPHGMSVHGIASGTSSSDTTAWVQLPEGMPVESPSLTIIVGPTVERGLLDVLFGAAPFCQILNQRIASATDATISDLMAAVAVQGLFSSARDSDNPQATAIDNRIRASISALVASQQDDGSWSWTGRGKGNRYVTARAAWSLLLATRAGYAVPDDTRSRMIQYLRSQIAATSSTDYESKAMLLHALAVAGEGDFPLANRLYRNRASLSESGLAYVALALAEMKRNSLAQDLLRDVNVSRAPGASDKRRGGLSWSDSSVELAALQALALEEVSPTDSRLELLIERLLKERVGHRWAPDKATGPATLVLARWYAKERYANEKYRLVVLVNGHEVKQLSFDENAITQTIPVPAEVLSKGKQRVEFQLNGRARFSYACILEGFVAAEQVRGTTEDWVIQRTYEAAPLERDGRELARGFDVVQGSYRSFRNPITQVAVGRRGRVTLRAYRRGVNNETPDEQLEYLVITEPLPSGVTVIESSISGGFERYEMGAGDVTFYVGNRRRIANISYDVYGYVPGTYCASPTVIRDAYQLDRFAIGAHHSLTVLDAGDDSADPYRLTPRELYELGKWHFRRREYGETIDHLTKLVSDWRLKPSFYKDSTRMLLDAHLEIGPANRVVQHFEVIKERWPDLEISYDKILKVGAAYHDMGEHERSYLIYRATVESSFLTDSQVAGFLQSEEELPRSVEYIDALLREYPPEPYVGAATFDLAQQVYAMASQAATNQRLRDQKITRVDLINRGAEMLDRFLTEYPEDPGADQAAFSRATALLELRQYERAINDCQRFVQRYPESRDLDGYWYTVGYCHFALGQHQDALRVCEKVVEMKRKDTSTGNMVPSDNRYRAIYILGQIYHSLGQAANAIKEYTRVEDRFADAKEAIQYFSRKAIQLPEVTTLTPGTPAEVPLSFRNIAQCEVKVYRIDLMKFGLLERNLQGITSINLAGIRPYDEQRIELGDGHDYRDRERSLELPLKDNGAYLIVCRGENLHTSGLVLLSPLALEVQEEPDSGRVRATVKDATDSQYRSRVHVKVIGSRNDDYVSGQTDLRGVFVADEIAGKTTVIAEADSGHYAFFRGKLALGPSPSPSQPPATESAKQSAPKDQKKSGEQQLLEGLMLRNGDIQGGNFMRQRGQYFNSTDGVTVEAVK